MQPLTLDRLLSAILPHVIFEGWSQGAFELAAEDLDVPLAQARAIAPRGAFDLAVHYHRQSDQALRDKLQESDLTGMRYSEKVAHAIWLRLQQIDSPDLARRSVAVMSLPHHIPQGTSLVWETADAIWNALGDTSDDANWYSKRAILSAVWSSTLLYWLGDTSPDFKDTRAFIDRRIEDVMQIEKTKSRLRESPVSRTLLTPFNKALSLIKAPKQREDLPGAR